MGKHIKRLAEVPADFPPDAPCVVLAEHRRARGEVGVYGPFKNSKKARAFVIAKYESGAFDPEGCEVEYKVPRH